MPATLTTTRRPGQTLIVIGFVGFQTLDAMTTHLGLASHHVELNALMAPLIATQGELAAYAIKGLTVAMLLAFLMLARHRVPTLWHAYRVAAMVTALAVAANVVQIVG